MPDDYTVGVYGVIAPSYNLIFYFSWFDLEEAIKKDIVSSILLGKVQKSLKR